MTDDRQSRHLKDTLVESKSRSDISLRKRPFRNLIIRSGVRFYCRAFRPGKRCDWLCCIDHLYSFTVNYLSLFPSYSEMNFWWFIHQLI